MKTSLTVVCAAILLAACATPPQPRTPSHTLNVPRDLSLGGKTYQQAFTNSNPKQAIWEFTTDGEKVENWQWTRLATINLMRVGNVPIERWVAVMQRELDNSRPRPQYSFTQQGNAVLANIVYPPSAQRPVYESNAWLVRTVPSCGGIVNLQFARQQQSTAGLDSAAEVAQLQRQIEADMAELQALDWLPSCTGR